MTWDNWVPLANSVLSWFLSIIPTIISLIMDTPVLGVPVILGIVGLVFSVVLRFVGAFKAGNKEE